MINTTGTINVRQLAMEALLLILEQKKNASKIVHDILSKHQYLSKQDRAFLSRLTGGTIERVIELDYMINQFSKIKVKKMKPVIRTIIRMGTYQIIFMDQVPDRAACNESVKLARKKGFQNLNGFVNGVLRNISRKKESLSYPEKERNIVAYLEIKYSMPHWIVEMWVDLYGEEVTESILNSFMETRNITIRVDTRKIDLSHYKEQLIEQGIEFSEGQYVENTLSIKKYNYVEKIPGYKEGNFVVQDESSMLAILCAGIKENMDILDVCAAPGGKTMFASWLLNGTGNITACDISERKVEIIRENVKRIGCTNVVAEVKDATELDDMFFGSKDVVIADLPCSGLGVIGRKPDIKYHCTQESIESLSKIQKDILSCVQKYVKPGGVLMFSTCTITNEENFNHVKWFLEKYPFELETISPYLPKELCNKQTDEGYLQILPGIHNMDGFFIARLRKRQ